MNRIIKKITAGIMAVLLLVMMAVPVVLAEDQSPADIEPQFEQKAEETAEPASEPGDSAEPQPEETQTAEPEDTAEPEAETATEPELVVIPKEQIPLAGGAEPSVTINADCNIGSLNIGDRLELTAELTGFNGMDASIRWQARQNGQWKDLKGENSTKLVVRITEDNADWAYRVAVDAQLGV